MVADACWQLSAKQLYDDSPKQHSVQVMGSGGIACARMVPVARGTGGTGRSSSKLTRSTAASGRTRRSGVSYTFGVYGWGMGVTGLYLYGNAGYASTLAPRAPRLPAVTRRPKTRKRIMLLMSDTGGGHRASAQALIAGFQKLYGSKYEGGTTKLCNHEPKFTQIDMVDLWVHHTPWPHNRLPRTYNFLVKYPWLWRLSYTLTQPTWVHRTLGMITGWQVGHRIAMAYDEYDPDLVVSVHPLMQDIPLRVLRSRMRQPHQQHVNFATVVTDLTTCHNTWFHPGVTKCFVPTEEARANALRMKLKPDQIVMHGLPIRPEFGERRSKLAMRKKLGLLSDKPTVLLIGGGEGMGPVEKTVVAMAKEGLQCQVVVVCGRNKALAGRLSSRQYPEGMHVVVRGFVSNMPEWMSAADAVITKAGPGTISEALICGLPILINANVPCQEEGNIPYVVHNKVGTCHKDPVKAAATIKSWFAAEHKGEFTAMAKRARALGKPDALFQIVRDLADLVA